MNVPELRQLTPRQESYDIGSEQDDLYSNIWPPSGVRDTFQPFFTSFFSACYQAECEILEALSIGLGLPPQTLSERHANQSNELRLTHYPAVSRSEFANSTRIATHTDFGTITLLFQDAVGGLRMVAPVAVSCCCVLADTSKIWQKPSSHSAVAFSSTSRAEDGTSASSMRETVYRSGRGFVAQDTECTCQNCRTFPVSMVSSMVEQGTHSRKQRTANS